jgi:protein-disulfide isomerase
MKKRSLRQPLFITLLFILALSAFGCAAPEGGTAGDSSAPAADSAERQPDANAPIVALGGDTSGAAETDSRGLEVGFTEDGHPYRGSLDAPVRMDAFSDFQCPFCGRFTEETLPTLMNEKIATGEMVLVFYDFPLTNIHSHAMAAANAARCAGEQGAAAYWAMHDRLFADIPEWSGSGATETFGRYADELGLDGAAIMACVDEGRFDAEIEADLDLGRSRGVSSTPSFFLNDQPLVGAYPADVFLQAIAAVRAGEAIATAADEPQQPSQPAVKPTPAAVRTDDVAASWGDPNAPVTIVEFTDYQCPFCARHVADTLPTLLTELVDSGRAYYQIKDFPLDNIHPEARQAAVAARCAGEQDAYWPMHDALFARQGEWSGAGPDGAAQVFNGIAGELSLDTAAFDACLGSGRFDAIIQDNLDEGVALGVRGTPSFFIDGFPISGAQPFELFDYAVSLAEEGTLADAYVQEQAAEPDPSAPAEVNIDGAHSIGDPDAPVVVVEFTDFQCPYCSRHFQETFPQIQSNFIDTGLVRYVFKDFPLTNIHPQATLAAQAARCAGEQEQYLTMHTLLFDNQGAWSGRADAGEVFVGLAEGAGLDSAAFRTCLESGQFEEAVAADLAEGVSLGVNGTPAFFINGYFLSGAQPFAVFEQAITELAAATP